jgi:RWD domain
MASDMDHAEEQEMEAEALAAIFDSHFTRTASNMWTIDLYPSLAGDEVNFVGCRLVATLPHGYPTALPELHVHVLQGLASDEHGQLLQALAEEEAQANVGVPSIFAVCERLREWLVENNVKGLDDQSMHAQMLRKQLQQSKGKEVSCCFARLLEAAPTLSMSSLCTLFEDGSAVLEARN